MNFNSETRGFQAAFKNMVLKKCKRGPGLKQEAIVTEEKYAMVFQATLQIHGELTVRVRTISTPSVVVVHGNQQASAEATMVWDTAFAEPQRLPFTVPSSVTWAAMKDVLGRYFKESTGQALTA